MHSVKTDIKKEYKKLNRSIYGKGKTLINPKKKK